MIDTQSDKIMLLARGVFPINGIEWKKKNWNWRRNVCDQANAISHRIESKQAKCTKSSPFEWHQVNACTIHCSLLIKLELLLMQRNRTRNMIWMHLLKIFFYCCICEKMCDRQIFQLAIVSLWVQNEWPNTRNFNVMNTAQLPDILFGIM